VSFDPTQAFQKLPRTGRCRAISLCSQFSLPTPAAEGGGAPGGLAAIVQLALEKAAPESERSSARGSCVTRSVSAPRAGERRLRRIAEHIQRLDNDEEEEGRTRQCPPPTAFQERNARFMEVNLLIERARKLAGREENPGEGTERQLEGIQRKLRKEMEKSKLNRTVMMSETARKRHNLRDRQKRHIQNEALLPHLRDCTWRQGMRRREQVIGMCN
jgi:hypothetical protein